MEALLRKTLLLVLVLFVVARAFSASAAAPSRESSPRQEVSSDVSASEPLSEEMEAPVYFGEPMLQDLRYLLAFVLGIGTMHALEKRQERSDSQLEPYQSRGPEAARDDDSAAGEASKFELYPYVL
eukprot:TRINITY_DN351_c0_g1_i1.p2 TRINITY_DN351_c0_g1~~TRINITY_DN351_c0_g1_i1.p2  ORF type:complete len:126 (+),score=24.75 TRINITY_DN351_c0_g1_i1:233-610(+)